MNWSWKIGRLAGTKLRIHATFLLLLAWILLNYRIADKSGYAMLTGVAFLAALVGCVLLHEMGHVIVARRFGIRIRDTTLLPIGGVARPRRIPEDPRQELWVALAGPAVNLAIAGVLYAWLTLTHQLGSFSQIGITAGSFIERLLMASIWLVLFNLIPAFPMDGGHVLRALLAPRISYPTATQLTGSVGEGLAFTLGFVGLFSNPILLFIGLFVWIGASQEASAAQMKSVLAGTPVSEAMLTHFETLSSSDTLADAVRTTLKGAQHDFPVLERERVAGILTRTDLLVALTEFGPDHPVTAVMRNAFLIADPAEMLNMALRRLRKCDCHTMPVVHDGRAVGLITMENLGEYLLIAVARQKRGRALLKPAPEQAGNYDSLTRSLLRLILGRDLFAPVARGKFAAAVSRGDRTDNSR